MNTFRNWKILIALGCAIILQLGGMMFGLLSDPYGGVDVNVYFDSELDSLAGKLDQTYVTETYSETLQPYRILSSTKEAALFVVTSDDDYKYDTEKYSAVEIAHSPIIALLPGKINSRDSGYEAKGVSVNGNVNTYWYKYDIKKILMECINSTDGKIDLNTLGFDVDDIKGKVSIAIPDVMYSSRRDVANSLLYILNDGQDITSGGSVDQKLIENFKNLMSKVTTFSMSEVSSIKENKDKIIFIPEFYLSKVNSARPLYWDDMYSMRVRLIYPNEYTGDALDEKVYKTSVEEFINNLKNSSDTKSKFFRNNLKWKGQGGYIRTALDLSTRYAENNLSNILGDKYWKTGEIKYQGILLRIGTQNNK